MKFSNIFINLQNGILFLDFDLYLLEPFTNSVIYIFNEDTDEYKMYHVTRAPRGTDRSPEYNEHFCYKLDSRVKNLTIEWNHKQQHFITHASRSLLWIRFVAVAFRSEEEVFWRRGPPPQWPILPRPGSAPGQIWPKYVYACARPWALHPYQVS